MMQARDPWNIYYQEPKLNRGAYSRIMKLAVNALLRALYVLDVPIKSPLPVSRHRNIHTSMPNSKAICKGLVDIAGVFHSVSRAIENLSAPELRKFILMQG